MARAGTKIGAGFVSVEPDFTGFQDEVEQALRRRLGGLGEKSGKQLGDDIRKGVRRSGSPIDESFFRPILQRFGKAGQDASRKFARGMRSEKRQRERDVSDALGLGAMSDFYREAQKAAKGLNPLQRALQRVRPHARGLAGDLQRGWRAAGAGPRAFGRALDGLQRSMTRANTRMMFFRNIIRLLRWPAVITGVGLLTQGLAALTAGFFAAASAAGTMSGALIALPALAATAAQAFSALKLATMGVGDTIKAALDAQVKGGGQAVDSLKRQRDATDRVADAERAYTQAQEATEASRKAVNDALRAARSDYRDLEAAAGRSYLVEEEGALRVKELRDALDDALKNGSELDIRLAENSLEQAKLDLKDIRAEAKAARQDYKTTAQAGGADQMPEVVAARKARADARQAEADAERDLNRAVQDSTDAMGAQGAAATKLAEEMGQLPPAAQAFVRQIVALKPKMDELRATAASGLFPGVSDGLKGMLRNFPVAKTLIGETATAMGDLARRTGKKLGSKEWGRDLLTIGRQNTRTLNQMGTAGLNVADTFRHLLVAARPFINWMGKGVVRLTGWMKTSAKAGRENGKLAAYFDRVKETMQAIGPILKGVGGGFLNLSKAARPLGMDILRSLGGAAEGWRKWTGSVEGQNSLREYFKDAKPAIFETGRLIRDATKAFFEIGNQPGAAKLIKQVRTELLPALTDTIGTLTSHFGPALVGALTSGVKLMQSLAHQSGPLVVVAETLGGLAKALTWVIEKVPGAKELVTAFLVLKGLKFAATSLGLKDLGKQAMETATQFRTAGAAAGDGFSGRLRGRLRAVKPTLTHLGKTVLGAGLMIGVANAITAQGQGWNIGDRWQALVSGLSFGALPAPREIDQRMATIVERIKAWRGRALTLSDPNRPNESLIRTDDLDDFTAKQRGLLKRMAELRNTADRMFGPGTRLINSAWAEPGKALKDLDRVKTGFSLLRSGALGSLKDIRFFSEQNMGIIRRVLGRDTKAGSEAAARNLRATARAFRIEMQRSGDWTAAAMRRHRRLIDRADLAGAGRRQAEAFGREWAAGMTHGHVLTRKGMDDLTKTMIRKMRQMRPGVRQAAFDTWNQQVQQAEKSGSLTGKQADRMRTRVLKSFDGLVLGAKDKAPKWADKVIANNARMTNISSNAFGTLVDNANSALSAFGVVKKLEYKAKKFAVPGEDKKQTGGFIVPGQGSGDTFHTAVEPGSFVLNRKATKAFGLQRGGLAPVALEPGERVFTPDEVKRVGAGRLVAANRAVQRFQTGGIVGIPWQPGEEVAASILPLLTRLHKKFGFTVTDAFDRDRSAGHKSPGHNLTGTAVDAAGGNLAGLVRWAVSKGLTTYWNGGAGATPLAGHDTHAHIEFSSAGALLGAAMEKLARITLDGPAGPLRDMGQAAIGKVRRAGDRMLAKKAMFSGSGDPFSAFGTDAGPGRATRAQMVAWATEALHRTGHGASPEAIEKILTLAQKESGWEVRSINNWDSNAKAGNPSGGLMHVTIDKVGGSYERLFDPIQNMIASINYQFGRYGGLIDFSPYAKGGLVRMVGDSLGVGTVGQGGLAGKLKQTLKANVLTGRFAQGSAGLFGAAKQLIFDLGTNDTSAGAPADVLRAVDRATGDTPIHALTLNGPLANAKNAALRGAAGGDVNLIPWAANSRGLLEPDGYHATGAGYGKRASMIAREVNAKAAAMKRAVQDKARKGKTKAGGVGSPVGEIDVSQMGVSQAIRQSLKRVRRPQKKKGGRARQMDALVARIKDRFALPADLLDRLAGFERDIPVWQDRGDRADSLTVELEDADGEPILDPEGRQAVDLGRMEGQTAGQWKQRELGGLLNYRNDLIEARVRIRELIEQVKARIVEQQNNLKELRKKITLQGEVRDQLADLVAAKHTPKKFEAKIKRLAREVAPKMRRTDLFGKAFRGLMPKTLVEEKIPAIRARMETVSQHRAANVRERDAIRNRILPALTGRRDALIDDGGNYETQLDEVQGVGGLRERTDKFFGQVPDYFGQFSGQIFDAHERLKELNTPGPIIKRTPDDPDHSGNLDEAIFDRYYGVEALQALQENISAGMQRLVPFGGVFHTGGVVPGPVGQERMALVQSGETIFTPDQMAQLRPRGGDGIATIEVQVLDGAVDPRYIRVIARDEAGKEIDTREQRERTQQRARIRG